MKKIDTIILGKYQSFSDWTQDVFGITNFFIAKYIISTLLAINEIWYVSYRVLHDGRSLILYAGSLIVILLSMRMPVFVKKIEALVSSNPNFKNPFAEMTADFRQQQLLPLTTFLFVFNTAISFSSFVFFVNNLIFWFSMVSSTYFLCCTPKPPSKSKLKKAIEKVKSFRISLPQTSPTLSPG